MAKLFSFFIFLLITSCSTKVSEAPLERSTFKFRLVTLDPGHFHAALVQKSMYPMVDSVVYVYAPEGNDLSLHLERIKGFNNRPQNPTSWKEVVYTGQDYLQRMLSEKKGNVVVIAGNNQKKTSYINESVSHGFHVLADKPMAINTTDFDMLRTSFETAKKNNVLVYDIMTERYEITTILQKEFSAMPEVFGEMLKGTVTNPAVTKESVHYFYKYVAGSVLTRPAWFFDVTQEGEGIVDVTTHLVDLVQWECFPGQVIDYTKDVEVLSARRWPTDLTLSQFAAITRQEKFPDYLNIKPNDSVLSVYSNGEINYKLKGVHAKVSVTWGYKAEEGAGDTHFSIMRGTRSNLIIKQGKEQGFKPTLYIEPADPSLTGDIIKESIHKISNLYPGVDLKKSGKSWEIIIPDKFKEGHEAHFARVAEKFFDYLQHGNMPEWEVPNMIAKYYTTTKALELARQGNNLPQH